MRFQRSPAMLCVETKPLRLKVDGFPFRSIVHLLRHPIVLCAATKSTRVTRGGEPGVFFV